MPHFHFAQNSLRTFAKGRGCHGLTAGKHETAVNEYVKTYDVLSNTHPVIVGLQEMARELDTAFLTTLAAQFQLTMRRLESLKIQTLGEEDSDDELLAPNR